jgi:dynein heavy chain
MRVFHDRLINEEDRTQFIQLLETKIQQSFKMEMTQVNNLERIIFCDFWQGRDADPRKYIQIPDLNELIKKMYEFQEDFNTDS